MGWADDIAERMDFASCFKLDGFRRFPLQYVQRIQLAFPFITPRIIPLSHLLLVLTFPFPSRRQLLGHAAFTQPSQVLLVVIHLHILIDRRVVDKRPFEFVLVLFLRCGEESIRVQSSIVVVVCLVRWFNFMMMDGVVVD